MIFITRQDTNQTSIMEIYSVCSVFNHTLNFHNWRLFCVLKHCKNHESTLDLGYFITEISEILE